MNPQLEQISDWPARARQAKWSVSKLAALCGVSVRGLQRHFLETRAQTPKAWLFELRQNLGYQLLCDGLAIKVASAELAYPRPEHFSRDFKIRWHCSPTQRCHYCAKAKTCLKKKNLRPLR